MSKRSLSRRAFVKHAIAAGAGSSALAVPATAVALQEGQVRTLDHVAIPIQRVEEMVAFYRALGFLVNETDQRVSVHFGDQKINMHYPSRWQNATSGLRAPAAVPPCGDFCWVWEGTREELLAVLERAEADIVAEGERDGGRHGGTTRGQSVYVRDPDGNLLEFMRYS
jgi:catechol 2,3-dioxygenase-like lactoylglutathione lyase family enzyme